MKPPLRQLPGPEYPEESRYYPVAAPAESFSVPMNHYVWVLRRRLWRILGFVFAVVTAVMVYSMQLPRQYESVATLEIENQATAFEVGDAGGRYDGRSFETVMTTQLELLNSTGIAQQVIRDLRLDQNPDFNPALRRKMPAEAVAVEMPLVLPGLSFRRRPSTYLIEVICRSNNPQLGTDIANSAARAFVQQGFMTRYQTAVELSKWLDKQLEELKARLERSQQDMRAFEKDHKIVNPEDRSNLMNQQLTKLHEELTKTTSERLSKEAAHRAVESGGLDSLTISSQGEPLQRAAERLELLETQLAEAAAIYGPNHPNYKRIENQIATNRGLIEVNRQRALRRLTADYQQVLAREKALADAVAEQKAEVDRLGAWAIEYGIKKREVESLTKLYDSLLTKINEARINASIRATNLRLASLATRPNDHVAPRVMLNVMLAFLLSTMLSIGVALAVDYLDRTLRSSEQVEQWLGLPVLATLPRVVGQTIPTALIGAPGEDSGRGAVARPAQPFLEALAMLRTSVLLGTPGQEIRLVLVASAAPSEGKTTVAAGLALALAQQLENGDRVLLIDSDLRRPTVHNVFRLPNRAGLSSVLEGNCKLAETIVPSGAAANLLVLPAGPLPSRTSELLTTHMAKLIEQVRPEFRYVVVDSPPLLVCADTTILSTLVDAVVVVTKAGETPRDIVAAALRQLRRVRANVIGVVLNQLHAPDSPGYSSYNYGYGGYYSSEEV